MQYFSALRFNRRMLRLILIFCIGPQLLAGIAEYLYLYQTAGDSITAPALHTVFLTGIDIIRSIALFACCGILVYLVFLQGLKGSGEVLLAEGGAIGLYLFLSHYIDGFAFAIIGAVGILLVECGMLIAWWNGEKRQIVLLITATILPLLSAVTALYGSNCGSVSGDVLGVTVLFHLIDRLINMLLLSFMARIALHFRDRALARGDGVADMSIGGRFFTPKIPLCSAYLCCSCLYGGYLLLSSLIGNLQFGEGISWIGGFTVHAAVITFLVPIGYAILSYVVMWLGGIFTEKMFLLSEDEQPQKR